MDWIEREIARIEDEVYGGSMPAHNKALLRKQLQKDERIWEFQNADIIRGYDDGEARP